MSRSRRKPPGDYGIGYRRPPSHTRFRKGRSGNPGGRPRGMTTTRAKRLALREAYRLITVREAGQVLRLPALQVLWRQLIAIALGGNGPAVRLVIDLIQSAEARTLSDRESELTLGMLVHESMRSDRTGANKQATSQSEHHVVEPNRATESD